MISAKKSGATAKIPRKVRMCKCGAVKLLGALERECKVAMYLSHRRSQVIRQYRSLFGPLD